MTSFWSALLDPDIHFLRYALLAGLLASFSFGVVGAYVVARRISYIAGAIAHSVLGGIGASVYLQYRFGLIWLHPLYGAITVALVAAVIIGLVVLKGSQREDTVIGAIWAVGMAAGLLLFSVTPGYIDPMSYLFGNILLISSTDIWAILALDVLVAGLGIVFYRRLQAVCFDDEFARLRRVPVDLFFLLLLGLTALAVVLLIRIVGIVLVIALLTLPAAVAGHFSRRLWQMMALAVAFCMFFVAAGLGMSYSLDLPAGPVIILFAGLVYIVVVIGKGRG